MSQFGNPGGMSSIPLLSSITTQPKSSTFCNSCTRVLNNCQVIRKLGILVFHFYKMDINCAFLGIQYAGLHLKELQTAFKNPTANLGLIFSEAGKRAFRSAGLSNGPSMTHLVAPPLKASAQLASKVIHSFIYPTVFTSVCYWLHYTMPFALQQLIQGVYALS